MPSSTFVPNARVHIADDFLLRTWQSTSQLYLRQRHWAVTQVCNQYGATLIVDEAHGAHLGLHPSMPQSALQQGAHVAVQSTHKTLGALTQAAMLHVGDTARKGLELRIRRHLSVLHTSSPSYLLMASLEAAAHSASNQSFWDEPLAAALRLRDSLAAAGLPCLHAGSQQRIPEADPSDDLHRSASCANEPTSEPACAAVVGIDPLRITCLATVWGMSGFDLYKRLDEAGVVAELATDRCVVFALGAGSTLADWQHAHDVISQLRPDARRSKSIEHFAGPPVLQSRQHQAIERQHAIDGAECVQSLQLLNMRVVLSAETVRVSASDAVGASSAAIVSVYPPGIPALVLGQIITEEVVANLAHAVARGARLVGCSADLSDLQVCKNMQDTA